MPLGRVHPRPGRVPHGRTGRPRRLRRALLAGVLVLVGATASAAVAACTAAPAPAPSRPAPSRPAPAASGSGPTSATDAGTTDAGTIDAGTTGPAPTDPGSTAAAGPSGTDLTVRALRDGLDATSGAVTLRVLGGSAPVVLDDGSVRVAAVDDTAGHDVDSDDGDLVGGSDDGDLVGGSDDGDLVRGSEDVRLVVAVPPPLTIDVLRDGTALVRDGDTPVAGVRADPEGRLRARDAAAVLTAPASSASGLWFTARSILDLSWGDREGGRSLAVTPADWARAGGLAADTLVWAQLSAAEPDARTATMHAQLSCHQLGARDKDTWNLEPWRPHVDAFELVAARCNPT